MSLPNHFYKRVLNARRGNSHLLTQQLKEANLARFRSKFGLAQSSVFAVWRVERGIYLWHARAIVPLGMILFEQSHSYR